MARLSLAATTYVPLMLGLSWRCTLGIVGTLLAAVSARAAPVVPRLPGWPADCVVKLRHAVAPAPVSAGRGRDTEE